MEINKKILEKNFLKLWSMERTNVPFLFTIGLINKKWGLPLPGEREKMQENCKIFEEKLKKRDRIYFNSVEFVKKAKIIDDIRNLKLPAENERIILNELIADQPTRAFYRDLDNFAKEFKFEKIWKPYLYFYLISGKIIVPGNKITSSVPSEMFVKQFQASLLNVKKKVQHDFLKKRHGFKTTRRKDNESNGKFISELKGKTELLPDALIHDDAEIADILFGKLKEEKLDDKTLSEKERKRNQIVRQYINRIKKKFVSLSDKRKKHLLLQFT